MAVDKERNISRREEIVANKRPKIIGTVRAVGQHVPMALVTASASPSSSRLLGRG